MKRKHACMHAYMHTYIPTCMHTYIHICIHTYIHTCMHSYIYAYIHTYIHAYTHTHTHTYTHTHTHTHVCACVCVRVRACMHACVRACMRAYVRACVRAGEWVRVQIPCWAGPAGCREKDRESPSFRRPLSPPMTVTDTQSCPWGQGASILIRFLVIECVLWEENVFSCRRLRRETSILTRTSSTSPRIRAGHSCSRVFHASVSTGRGG